MAEDLQKAAHGNQNNIEYLNQEMVCAMLRWQQWFENPYVDHKAIKLRQPTKTDFDHYRQAVLQLLSQCEQHQGVMIPKINELLITNANNLIAPGPDFNERLITLITMGACEYHGFNAAFTDSIKQHGLNPQAKFLTQKQLEPIQNILHRIGQKQGLGLTERDQNVVYVTTNPYAAYLHAKTSPEWFYYLCAGYMHDYEQSRAHILNFSGQEKLTPHDRTILVEFFEKWWAKLNNDKLKIAMMPMFRDKTMLQNRLNFNLRFLHKFGYEKSIKKFLDCDMYFEYEHIYDQPIQPKWLQIIDIPNQATHQQKLTQLQNSFANTNLKKSIQTVDTQVTIA